MLKLVHTVLQLLTLTVSVSDLAFCILSSRSTYPHTFFYYQDICTYFVLSFHHSSFHFKPVKILYLSLTSLFFFVGLTAKIIDRTKTMSDVYGAFYDFSRMLKFKVLCLISTKSGLAGSPNITSPKSGSVCYMFNL